MTYGGKQWYKVGFRLKGNSSLSNAWRSGNYKFPFRLDFDQFEDQYPEIKNQRFYKVYIDLGDGLKLASMAAILKEIIQGLQLTSGKHKCKCPETADSLKLEIKP